MAQATVFNPRTKERKVVTIGDPDAFAGGFILETPTNNLQTQTQPTVQRETDGGISTLTDPLTQFKNQTVFMNTAKDIIRQKQGQGQDISKAKQYWRSLIGQTQPFGGKVDPADEIPGRFTDERFRLLSPQQQASVRTARTSTAQAHLRGLAEEQTFRETRVEDTLQVLRDLWKEQNDAEDARLAAKKEGRDIEMHNLRVKKLKLDIAEAGKEAGLKFDADGNVVKDVSSADANLIADAIKQIESGGNYEARGGSDEYGAYQYTPGTWENYSNQYLQSIGQGGQSLQPTPENQDAVTLFKINQWLQQGFKPEEIAAGWNWGEGNLGKDFSKVTGTNKFGIRYDVPSYVNRFRNVLATLLPEDVEELELTDAKKTGLMQTAGLSNADVKGYTADDWILLQSVIRDSIFEEATLKVNGGEGFTAWKKELDVRGTKLIDPDPELIKARLIEDYGDFLDASEIETIMRNAGFIKDESIFSGKWKRP